MILILHISIELYIISSIGQLDVYPEGRLLINGIPCVTLLTVTFITDAGQPDMGS